MTEKNIKLITSILLSILLIFSTMISGVGVALAEGEAQEDTTPPVIQSVGDVFEASKYIEGQVSEAATVTVETSQDGSTWTALVSDFKTDAQNKFKIEITPPLAIGTQIRLYATDLATNTNEKETIIKVKADQAAPTLLKDVVVSNDGINTIFTGQLSEKVKVEAFFTGLSDKNEVIVNSLGKVTSNEDGTFELKIPLQKENAKLSLIFKDMAQTANQLKTIVTIPDLTKPTLAVDESVLNTSKTIIGSTSERATVTATVNGKSLGKATVKKTNDSGKYQFVIKMTKKIEVGDVIDLIAKDYGKPKALESAPRTITVQ